MTLRKSVGAYGGCKSKISLQNYGEGQKAHIGGRGGSTSTGLIELLGEREQVLEKEVLLMQAQERLDRALSHLPSKEAVKVKRARGEAIDSFKRSDSFKQEVACQGGVAIHDITTSIKGDLSKLYPKWTSPGCQALCPSLILKL